LFASNHGLLFARKERMSIWICLYKQIQFECFDRLPPVSPVSSAGGGWIGFGWMDKRVMGGSGGLDG